MRNIAGVAFLVAAVLGAVYFRASAPPPALDQVTIIGTTQEQAATALALAESDATVAGLLLGTQYAAVEIEDPHDDKSGILVWFIDYTNNRAVFAEVDLARAAVVDRQLREVGEPLISPAERAIAVSVASVDAEVLALGLPTPLHVSNLTRATKGPCVGQRCVALFVDRATEPIGYEVVIVDVVKREVVQLTRGL